MSQIASALPVDQAVRGSANRFNELSSEDFIRIIFSELSNQDPFAPNDSSALLEQLNSIRSIESDILLTERLQDLVFENQLAGASNMLGKMVTGLTNYNERVSGVAVGVFREGDVVQIELDSGWRIPVEGIESITEVSPRAPLGLADPVNPTS